MNKHAVSILALAFAVAACAGKTNHTPPTAPASIQSSIVVDQPQGVGWKRRVRNLSKNFYVINNLDASSGLINVSYSSDPEAIIDCGRVSSYVKNARGERTYDFPGAKAQETYEIMDMQHGAGLLLIDRKISVEGRANIIVQAVDQTHTSVSVSAKYVVSRSLFVRNTIGQNASTSDSISFNTGNSAAFGGETNTTCRATGRFESDVLQAAQE